MESIREQMFILIILKLFRDYNNPSVVFEWIKVTAMMTGLDLETMLRLTLRIMREEHNIYNLEYNVVLELYRQGAKINDIINLTGKARSTCYQMLKGKPRSYIKRFDKDDDLFILKALKAFNKLGGGWY